MASRRSTGMPRVDAQHDFLRARRRAGAAKLIARLRREPDDVGVILPYEEVVQALGFVSERPLGLQVVPLESIVGTVDRGRDFDRRFRPTSRRVRSRWENIAAAMRRGEALPPSPRLSSYAAGWDLRARCRKGNVNPQGRLPGLRLCSLQFKLASRAMSSPGPTPTAATGPIRRRYAPRLPPGQRREQLLDAALSVILELGYSGVSIEAIARTAGVTRPVVYDHFPNLGRLLHALVEREERVALDQLEHVLPADTGSVEPGELLAGGGKRFLDAVASCPATWRIILLPPDGTPAIVREHVETNRASTLRRIEQVVELTLERPGAPAELDVELTARAIRDLGEEAGRMVLTDPERYPPERYEHFVETIIGLIWRPPA